VAEVDIAGTAEDVAVAPVAEVADTDAAETGPLELAPYAALAVAAEIYA